jgi:surface antigen
MSFGFALAGTSETMGPISVKDRPYRAWIFSVPSRQDSRSMKMPALLVACAAALTGCVSTGLSGVQGGSARDDSGQVAAAIVEAMAGGIVGQIAGLELDRGERRKALEAEYRALEYTPSGQAVVWRSSDSRYGEVVAAQPYRVGSQDCRQYVHAVQIGGERRTARGTACRNGNGSWTPLT